LHGFESQISVERDRPGIDLRALFCLSCRDGLSGSIVIMVVVMVVIVVISTVILVVPVSLMHRPSAVIVIVVRMAPVGARVWRPVPAACHPAVVIVHDAPVTVDPDKAVSRHWGADLIANRRWWCSDINLDLAPYGGRYN